MKHFVLKPKFCKGMEFNAVEMANRTILVVRKRFVDELFLNAEMDGNVNMVTLVFNS